VLDVCSPSLIHLSPSALIAVAGIWGLLQPTTRPARSLGGTCEALVGAVGGLTEGLGIGVACFHAFSSATITRSVLALVTASGLALLFA
jgi:hypothetical protein